MTALAPLLTLAVVTLAVVTLALYVTILTHRDMIRASRHSIEASFNHIDAARKLGDAADRSMETITALAMAAGPVLVLPKDIPPALAAVYTSAYEAHPCKTDNHESAWDTSCCTRAGIAAVINHLRMMQGG